MTGHHRDKAPRLLFTGLNGGSTDDYVSIVGAAGTQFLLEDGRRLIDASNTGGPLGHAHPDMVAAVRAAADLPVINEGWRWGAREQAAEDLLGTTFADEDWVGGVRFCISGSEANDLALSLAQAITGRAKIVTRERAYHGMTGLARDATVQPHWHGGISRLDGRIMPVPRTIDIGRIPAPQGSLGAPLRDEQLPEPVRLSAELRHSAATIIDYTQGGAYHSPLYQDRVATAASAAGSLWVADEVVTGLGRSGVWFVFQNGESRPDIVTLGKPLAGGAAPAGAVVVSKRVLAELGHGSWQTYSTFRAHPIMISALRAHLGVVVRDELLDRVLELAPIMASRMRDVVAQHPSVSRVDGRGLHWTVELHGPSWREWTGVSPEVPIASTVAVHAARAGALIGTSGEQTSVFLAPPLIISEHELDRIFDALHEGLAAADRLQADASRPISVDRATLLARGAGLRETGNS